MATPTLAPPIAVPVPLRPVANANVQQLLKKAYPTKAEKEALALHGQKLINWYHTHKSKLTDFESRL